MFEKNLTDLVRGIRNNKSSEVHMEVCVALSIMPTHTRANYGFDVARDHFT